MGKGKRFLAVLSGLAMTVTMTVGMIGGTASAESDIDIGQAITDGKWKFKDGAALPVDNGEVAIGDKDYVFMDQDFERGTFDPAEDKKTYIGGRVEFDFKATLGSGKSDSNDWEFTFNMLDTAIGKPFWDGASSQICFSYTPSAKKLTASVVDGTPVGSTGEASNVTLADGHWHTIAITVGGNGWGDGRKIHFKFEVDGQTVLNHEVWADVADRGYSDAEGFNNKFKSGKLSIYSKSNYNLAIRAEEPVAPPPPVAPDHTFDIAKAIEDGLAKYTDGTAVGVGEGIIDARDSGYFYIDQTVVRGNEVEFMIKLKNKGAAPAAGWQLALSLIDQTVGKPFWDSDAKSVNLQLTDFGDGTGGTLNLVYKNGATAVFNEADSSFESDIALFDGEWHKLTMKYDTADEGGAKFLCKIDGELFVDKTVNVGGVNFDDYFESGKMVFYAAASPANYNLMLAPAVPDDDDDDDDDNDDDNDDDKPAASEIDFAGLLAGGKLKTKDGAAMKPVNGIVKAPADIPYFYLDTTMKLGDSVKFMLRATKKADAEPKGWALTLGLLNQQIGAYFWDSNAKNANIQFQDLGDATGAMVNAVYKDGAAEIFNEYYADFECEKLLFDGKWHEIMFKVEPKDGKARFYATIDGAVLADQIFEEAAILEKLNEGKISFYSSQTHEYELKAVGGDTPKPPVTGESGLAAAMMLAAASAGFVLLTSFRKKA